MTASHVDTWILDARCAMRLLRKSQLFTAVATLSLARASLPRSRSSLPICLPGARVDPMIAPRCD